MVAASSRSATLRAPRRPPARAVPYSRPAEQNSLLLNLTLIIAGNTVLPVLTRALDRRREGSEWVGRSLALACARSLGWVVATFQLHSRLEVVERR